MTKETLRSKTLDTVVKFIHEATGEEWAAEFDITTVSSLSDDLGLDSIEFIALTEKMQRHYGDAVDFSNWLQGKDLNVIIGITVGDIVELIIQSFCPKPTE